VRPYPDQLLRSIRQSLTEVVIPKIDDDWARYVARSLEKIVEHLERRWRYELAFAVEDVRELAELLRELQASLAEPGLAERPELAAPRAAIERRLAAGAAPDAAPDLRKLTEQNERYRRTLVAAIDRLEDAAGDATLGERLEPVRARIRKYLRRHLDRELVFTAPTDMLFDRAQTGRERTAAAPRETA
jgi:hypothetical protein